MRKPTQPKPPAQLLTPADLPQLEIRPVAQLTRIALELAEDTYHAQCETIAHAARKLEGIGKDWSLNISQGQWMKQKRKGAK